MINAELPFESGLWRFVSHEFEDKRIHSYVDSRNLVCASPIMFPKLQAAIDDRMGNDSTGERLISVQADFIRTAQIIRNRLIFASGDQDICPTRFRLDAVLGGGEIL